MCCVAVSKQKIPRHFCSILVKVTAAFKETIYYSSYLLPINLFDTFLLYYENSKRNKKYKATEMSPTVPSF